MDKLISFQARPPRVKRMIFGSTRARTDKLVTEKSVRMILPSDFGFLVGYRGPFGEVTSLKNQKNIIKNKISSPMLEPDETHPIVEAKQEGSVSPSREKHICFVKSRKWGVWVFLLWPQDMYWKIGAGLKLQWCCNHRRLKSAARVRRSGRVV